MEDGSNSEAHPENYVVHRPVYSLSRFDQNYKEEIESTNKQRRYVRRVGNFVKQSCTPENVKNGLIGFVPFYNVLRKNYNKSFIPWDILAGFTMAIFQIPQGMAYGLLAGVKPVYGLYTSFYPALIYFFFGTSLHLSVGTFSLVSLIIGDALAPYQVNSTDLPDEDSIFPYNGTHSEDFDVFEIAACLTFLCGAIQLIMGLLHLGFLTVYLSDAMVSGFTTGATIQVFVSQVVACFGIELARPSKEFKVFKVLYGIFANITETNPATIITSLVCILLLVLTKELINPRMKKKCSCPIPIELIVVLLSLMISYLAQLHTHFGVAVVGEIPKGLKVPSIPKWENMEKIVASSFPLAIVGFAMSAALVKVYSLKYNYEVNYNQELNALGICNLFGSFFGCIASAGALARTSVIADVGMKSQITGLVSSVIMLPVLLWLGPYFSQLPKCTLSAIIIVALKGMFMQITTIKDLWKVSIFDFLIWVVTFLATVCLDVTYGLIIGFLFSIMTIVFRTQRPRARILGRIPNTDIYKDKEAYKQAMTIPGLNIFRLDGAIYFANAEYFRESLFKKTNLHPERIMDAIKAGEIGGEIAIRPDVTKPDGPRIVVEMSSQAQLPGSPAPRYGSNSHLQPPPCARWESRSKASSNNLSGKTESDLPIHHLIIDCSTWAYIDSVGIRVLKEVVELYKRCQIIVFLAGCKASVRRMFVRTKMYETTDKEFVYLTVHDAVLAALSDYQDIKKQIMEDVSVFGESIDIDLDDDLENDQNTISTFH